MTVLLLPGQIRRLDARAGIRHLLVVHGCVWLTTTPADGDIVLKAGDTWIPREDWPIVVEAIGTSTAIRLATVEEPSGQPAGVPGYDRRRDATMNEA